jgi:hypothetical protein
MSVDFDMKICPEVSNFVTVSQKSQTLYVFYCCWLLEIALKELSSSENDTGFWRSQGDTNIK